MKKLLILGGTKNQVPLIQAAKNEGYYVIVCDWTTTNPGIALADKHYQVSTMDRNAVFAVAKEEEIDGIISNSEPVMENVSFVAEVLGLRGNSIQSIQCFMSKSRFRKLQKEAGVYAPTFLEAKSYSEYKAKMDDFELPIVIKPSQNSGSRGTTVINQYNKNSIEAVFKNCSELSRNDLVTVEEYVAMPSLRVIEGDIFFLNGKVLWDGLFTTYRSEVAPLIPMTYLIPSLLSESEKKLFKEEVEQLIKESGVSCGEFNVEAYYTKKGELFIIEINPRQGGNGIPEFIKLHSGIDLNRILVTTAVRDDEYFNSVLHSQNKLIVRHEVFSHRDGILRGIYIDDNIVQYISKKEIIVDRGTIIKECNSFGKVAEVDFEFEKREQQIYFAENMEKYVYPIVEQ